MDDIVKDIKIVSACSRVLKGVCLFKTLLTVGIIVFTVLESARILLSPRSLRKITLGVKQ